MSSDRRKSKFPKKCEDFLEVDDSKTSSLCNLSSEDNLKQNKIKNHRQVHNFEDCEGNVSINSILLGSNNGYFSKCNACSLTFKDWLSTVEHIRSHRLTHIPLCIKEHAISRGQSVSCMLCQNAYDNFAQLVSHALFKHDFSKPPFICPFCSQNFCSAFFLWKHFDVTDVCMKCPVCSIICSQEYELYVHLSTCLPTFHPHLKTLSCSICSLSVLMSDLPNHMMTHSQKSGNIAKNSHLKDEENDEKSVVVENITFLCEICNGRFSSVEDFRDHLSKHSDTKMFCSLCYLKGFDDLFYVVRHMVLRCPKRTRQQVEFGAVISTIGKEQKLSFLQVLRKFLDVPFFREGMNVWTTEQAMRDVLANLDNLKEENIPSDPLLTDIELFIQLSEFEKASESCEENGSSVNDKALNSEYRLKNVKKSCSDVIFLHDVNVDRLQSIYDQVLGPHSELYRSRRNDSLEMQELFTRLEWEAQYLRKLEPFYVSDGTQETRWSFSPLRKGLPKAATTDPSSALEDTVNKIKGELSYLEKEGLDDIRNSEVDEETIARLIEEARNC